MPAKATPVTVPSPFGGQNTRDGTAALQPNEARLLINWDCEGLSCKPRKGYTVSSTGGQSSIAVSTLVPYDGASSRQRIGVNGGKIWDFSSSVAVQLYDGMYASDRFQCECYNNYLIGVNGVDTPWAYNGTAVAATGFSGASLTLTNLVNVRKVRNRLWFCENNSADVWYGGVGSITGTLTKFQLSQVVSGGFCMAIGAHSQDAGAGPDDYTAFVMSTGEVVVYSGDPSTTFTKVGNYSMPPPIGRKCLVNIGGPLAVITTIGLVPVQSAVAGVAGDIFALGNYGKLAPSLTADAAVYKALSGWEAVYHEGKVIINVPVATDESKQRVYNALTGAWTTWEGLDAACLCVQDGEMYFGSWSDGKTYKRGGQLDNGSLINLTSRGASSTSNGRRMVATAIRFDMLVEGSLSGRYGLDENYIEKDISALPLVDIASSTATTPWGSPWGSAWSDSNQYGTDWQSIEGEGQALGVALEATASFTNLEWLASHVLLRQVGIR